jgi:hypothetical protein
MNNTEATTTTDQAVIDRLHEIHETVGVTPELRAAKAAYDQATDQAELEVVAWRVYHDWEGAPGEDYYIGPADNGSLDKAIAVRLSEENAHRIVQASAAIAARDAEIEQLTRDIAACRAIQEVQRQKLNAGGHARAAAAEASLAKAVELLRPFAEKAEGYSHLPWFETDDRFAHIRAARDFISEQKP